VQELGEDGVEVVVGPDELVVQPQPGATSANLDEVFLQRFHVAVAQRLGIAEQVGQLLHALEASRPREWERHLVLIQDVEDQDVVLPLAQQFQPLDQWLAIDQEVRYHHHHPPGRDAFRHPPQDAQDVRLLARLARVHGAHDGVHVRHLTPRRDDVPDGLVERDHSHGIELAQQQIS